MNYEEKLKNVTIIGAAGKMGSGILLLTALEMGDLSLKPENKGKQFILNAMDISHEGLSGLMRYLRVQIKKNAEKKIVGLRKVYEDRQDLISNEEIINEYVFDVMNLVRPVTTIESAYESTLVFEAASENPELKIMLLSKVNNNNQNKPWFLTNTSSIPIKYLDQKIGLSGRILGFHFYNPPAVQKLVELITTPDTNLELIEFAKHYAKNLKKIVVPSNDYAGFIGNGHFMRDALHAMSEVEKLAKEIPFVQSLYTVNRVCQEFLVRPMGIFQLIDYVGIDVCQFIMKVMQPYNTDEIIHSPMLDKMMELGVKGGQKSDGSQKDGFLKYEKGKPFAIYDINTKNYINISDFQQEADARIGNMPTSFVLWKTVVKVSSKDELLKKHFSEIAMMDTLGAKLALKYMKRSKEIGLKLFETKVANNPEDVNTVMLTGFFHAYGPINNYIE